MKNSIYASLFFLTFLTGTFLSSIFVFPQAWNGAPSLSSDKVWEGTWTSSLELYFSESVSDGYPVKDWWGKVEWALFQQGRKGVFIAQDKTLYADEELFCLRSGEKHFAENAKITQDLQREMEKKDIVLIPIIVPAKAHVDGNLPVCKYHDYAKIGSLFLPGTLWVDGYKALLQERDMSDLYFRQDTHWRPSGASAIARKTAGIVRPFIKREGIRRISYTLSKGGDRQNIGDLIRYLPGMESQFLPETLDRYTIVAGAMPVGLMDNYSPDIVLAGTSYSQNSYWNFEGFLKSYLRADILNVSQSAKTPVEVITDYLNSEYFRQSPPKIILWEIPERHLFLP